MKQPHKHAELIKAWADGAEIQYLRENGEWVSCIDGPAWCKNTDYRIKPEPKPDVIRYGTINYEFLNHNFDNYHNAKFTFDGETGKLKSAEVL